MPRFLHRAYARLLRYYWLPCPVCGRMFGGHEKHGGFLLRTHTESSTTCSQCPGFCVGKDDRFVQLEPFLTEGETIDVTVVTASSEWSKRLQAKQLAAKA